MNSVLNPEAPEFHPLLTSAVQNGLSRTTKTVRTSNTFPLGHSHSYYQTYTNFGVVTCRISENVAIQSNKIAVAELPEVNFKCGPDENTEKIIDVNDSLLDRININIDTLTGVNKPSEDFLKGMVGNFSGWNMKPIVSKIQVGDTIFIGAKNLPRPQLFFKDMVDNSSRPWVPKISDKPNNIKPLALNILYGANGEVIGYEHPYRVELDLYQPPAHIIDLSPALPDFPLPLAETPLTMVDTVAQLDELLMHLQSCDEIAVDVEHHSYRSYQGITCLIQITTFEGGDFIIDTLALRQHVHKLNDSFTDPKKVKIFHGADNDVMWLQRDFGVYIVGLFDTFQAGKLLNLPSLSLKNLLARYCNIEIDKKYQMADWRIRPLPEELIEYARTDTHYLLYTWRVMRQHLLDNAAGAPDLLLSAFEKSRITSGLTYNKPVINDDTPIDFYTRSKKKLNWKQFKALKMLYKWRDEQAREVDEGPSYLVPNQILMNLAEKLPREIQGIKACCVPMPTCIGINLLPIHKMILSCRELTEPVTCEQPAYEIIPQQIDHKPHDLAYLPEYTEDQINLDMAWPFLDQSVVEVNGVRLDVQPDATALAPAEANLSAGIVSTLNVDAEMYYPPYDRHRMTRAIFNGDEVRGVADKAAGVADLNRGNELFKTDALHNLQAQRDKPEASAADSSAEPEPGTVKQEIPEKIPEKLEKIPEKLEKIPEKLEEIPEKLEKIPEKLEKIPEKLEKIPEQPDEIPETSDEVAETSEEIPENAVAISIQQGKANKKAFQRKRKIDKAAASQPVGDKKEPPKAPNEDPKVKTYHYKNVNYKKFYSESEKAYKQPKMKFKKP